MTTGAKTLRLAIFAIATISILVMAHSSIRPAFATCAVAGYSIGEGGGTTYYNPQPLPVGGRQLDVDIRVLHDLFNYNYNGTTRSISFRLCDTNGDKNMSDVTYQIAATKEGSHEIVLNNTFYSVPGLLELQIQNNSATEIMPYVKQDPSHGNALVANSNGTVNLKGPFLWEPGVYDMAVKILGFGSNGTHHPGFLPAFGYTTDVPDMLWEEVRHENSTYRIKVLATQKIESFRYYPDMMRLSWSVSIPQVQILNNTHQVFSEVEIPRSFYEFSQSPFLNATIGGKMLMPAPMDSPIPNRDMMVGLVVPNSLLESILKNASSAHATTVFTLAPLMNSSTHLVLGHGVRALVSWSPSLPIANASETLHLRFLAADGTPLRNAVYDAYLSNRHGTNFEHYDMRVATDGTDSEDFFFPQNDTYKIYLHLRGVSNSSAPHDVDTALDGDAYGYVVVSSKSKSGVMPSSESEHNTKLPFPRDLVTPLEQVRMGIQPQAVRCDWSGYELVLRAGDGSPACMSPQTAKIVIERGWGYFPLNLR